MTRRSPYKHPVTGHYRLGKYIDRYTRGSGKKPVKSNPHRGVGKGGPGNKYKVTVYYSDSREARAVDAGTFTDAVADGTRDAPELPRRVRVRRLPS